MRFNMGSSDRVIRGFLGVAILGVGYYFHSLWGLIGLIPLLTALTGWCPLYVPFGIKTTRRE
jgi:hypothetical protein